MAALNENDLRDVLLVRAFEEASGDGELLAEREGEVATREARASLGASGSEVQSDALLVERARLLRVRIDRSYPSAARVREASAHIGVPLWLVFLLSLLFGLAVDRLGASGSINLLSFPILGLLAWNLGVYVVTFVSDLVARPGASAGEGEASRRTAGGFVARGVLWAAAPQRFWRGGHARGGDGGAVGVALQRYARDWFRIAAPLFVARGRTWLHVGAIGVVLGAIGGLYLRGLVLHYDASWESTFLTADAVHGLLEFLFSPAAALLGQPVPTVEAIAAMRAPAEGGDAALWIHYYAVTAALFVVLPRGLMALFASVRSRRLSRALPFDLEGDAYFLKLLSVDRGGDQVAVVQAYSYRPSPRSAEGLTTLLLDVLGGRTRIERLEPSEYGDAPAQVAATRGEEAVCRVVLFTIAQSPEHEVHGDYLRALRAAQSEGGGRRSLLVVLDRGPLLERLPRDEEGATRLAERERAWQRVLDDAGLQAVACTLDGEVDATAIERAREGLLAVSGGAA